MGEVRVTPVAEEDFAGLPLPVKTKQRRISSGHVRCFFVQGRSPLIGPPATFPSIYHQVSPTLSNQFLQIYVEDIGSANITWEEYTYGS
jgi:hypothetical protein